MRSYHDIAERLVESDGSGIVNIDIQRHPMRTPSPAEVFGGLDQRTADALSLDLRRDVQPI